jgi:hypothetical protein
MWSEGPSRISFVQHPSWQLHIFENSTLVDDKELGLEVFVQQPAFSELGILAEEFAHQIEDGTVKDQVARFEHFATDGLYQMAFTDHAGSGMKVTPAGRLNMTNGAIRSMLRTSMTPGDPLATRMVTPVGLRRTINAPI